MIRRIRTFALWTGTTLCVLIAAAFVVSGWWRLAVQVQTPNGPAIAVTEGSFSLALERLWRETFVAAAFRPTWRFDRIVPVTVYPPFWRWWNYWGASDRKLFIPLYALFLAVAVPTLLVWRFVPKFPRGHCRRCGYNLKGLTEARCPECGAEFDMVKRRLPPGH